MFIGDSKMTNEEQNLLKQIDEDYRKAVEIFLIRLCKKIPHFDRTILLNNLETLKFKDAYIFNFLIDASATYSYFKNEIELNKLEMYDSIFHELFHTSTYQECDDFDAIGFCKMFTFLEMGNALNEGYTEYLTEKYFKEYDVSEVYELEIIFVSFIEHIVGRRTMETLYSKADLEGLIRELSKYNDRDSIIKFIKNMDYILKREDSFLFRRKVERLVLDNCNFLIECYWNKLMLRYKNHEITKEIVQSNLNILLKSCLKK